MTTPLNHHYYFTDNGPPLYYYHFTSCSHRTKATLTKTAENARIAGWTQLPAQWMLLVRRHVLATLLLTKPTRPTRQMRNNTASVATTTPLIKHSTGRLGLFTLSTDTRFYYYYYFNNGLPFTGRLGFDTFFTNTGLSTCGRMQRTHRLTLVMHLERERRVCSVLNGQGPVYGARLPWEP